MVKHRFDCVLSQKKSQKYIVGQGLDLTETLLSGTLNLNANTHNFFKEILDDAFSDL